MAGIVVPIVVGVVVENIVGVGRRVSTAHIGVTELDAAIVGIECRRDVGSGGVVCTTVIALDYGKDDVGSSTVISRPLIIVIS